MERLCSQQGRYRAARAAKKVRWVSLGRDKGTKVCHQPDETFGHNKSRNVSLIETKVGQFVSNVFDKLTHKPEHA